MNVQRICKAFGVAVKREREKRNMTQEQLGFWMGVTQVTIFKIEDGKQESSLTQALLLSKLLGISLDNLPLRIKVIAEEPLA